MSKNKNRAKQKPSKGKPSGNRPKAYGGLGWLVLAVAAVAGLMFLSETDETTRPTAASPSPSESRQAASPAPERPASPPPQSARVEDPVPPYYEDPEAAKPFPALVPSSRYGIPVVARAYEIAADIPEVLAQQPCYCNCGVFGHGSLLDCFASDHGST